MSSMIPEVVTNIAARHLRAGSDEIRRVLSEELVARVFAEGEVDDRDALCNLIGEFSLGEYAPLLIVVLEGDRSPCVRHDAAFALGRIADPETRVVLEKAAKKDESILVRHEATLALSSFPDVESVLLAARNDANTDVAETADVALAQYWRLEKRRSRHRTSLEEV
jgi:HEAT repeat protein